ncbi:MAG: vanadium nitrogenase [Lachnospiraceae bacterium]|jgi:hypothetical protein|nr:vanadium nitrogenase [Lachnospiraceae bacterium]MBQ1607639.1 vanadium nitrogenase [Lachnospiraceae bacterium]MBQ1720657.1 vanadium nitrogenase [Lachnospiraceae bacterium]MBQ5387134.1 vanadium nitrogenase [Lachnospiraceae bacterium]MBR0428713.1 vanadium nitrogenase [Lachnospiraceae bacterium]
MTAFLGSFLQYLIIMIILIVVAVLGAKIGIALRKSKDAKAATAEAVVSEASSSEENR